ncbi:MAG: cytochrome C oxidase subunit IV family protein [Candidatus Heimdallarchaeota archaeon]|nr:cytochrome C oxidase subunit IV family protein [Candidatus Heimdallarchaeota archaeon]
MTEEHPKRPYVPVLIFLAVLTIVEIAVGQVMATGPASLFILLFMALVKAGTVVSFYMHVKYESKPSLLVAIVFLIPLAIAGPIALFPAFG